MLGFLSGKEEFDEMTLEASRSSVMFEIIEREKTIGDAGMESLLNHLRHMAKDYNQQLLKQVNTFGFSFISTAHS